MSFPFKPLFFEEPRKDTFVPLVPTTDEYTSPNSDLLRQAIEDSLKVKATALANAQAALMDAFDRRIENPTQSLDTVDKAFNEAIDDVKPQIGYPGYVKPTRAPKIPDKEPDKLWPLDNITSVKPYLWGMPRPSQQYIDDLVASDVDEEKEEEDNYDDKKDTDIFIDTYSNAISHSLSPTYYKPNPDPSGAFQHSLKSKSNTNEYDFIVAIGNPHNNRLILNCIENSRKELIYFKDNRDVIQEAIDRFNIHYDFASDTKTILAGWDNDLNDDKYLNISLRFNRLEFNAEEIKVIFSKYNVIACNHHNMDYIKCIKETVYFYLKGELYLNEDETKIESMEIIGLNYANPSRNIISEKFVYLH